MVCGKISSPTMKKEESAAVKGTMKMKLLAFSAPIFDVAKKYKVVANVVVITLENKTFPQNFGSVEENKSFIF